MPHRILLTGLMLIVFTLSTTLMGDDSPSKSLPMETAKKNSSNDKTEDAVPLNPQKTVWLNRLAGTLILDTEVVFRNGLLEMLVCLKQTKEHESILALDSQAQTVHAGLLALGIDPGTPVSWDPVYRPPNGPVIEISVMWQDEHMKWKRSAAQDWIRQVTRKYHVVELEGLPAGLNLPEKSELRYDKKHKELLWFGIMQERDRDEALKLTDQPKFQAAIRKLFNASQVRPMKAEWVFAGSGFYVDPSTGEKHYLAEDGNLICVANFGSSTIDVRERSSADAAGLTYESWEERIPPLGTKVRVILKPKLKGQKTEAGATPSTKKKPGKS